jgi:hypothetical protein
MWWYKTKQMNAEEDRHIIPADGMKGRHDDCHLKEEFIDTDETMRDEYACTGFTEELRNVDIGDPFTITHWSSVGEDDDIPLLGHVDVKAPGELTSPLEFYQHIAIFMIIIYLVIKSFLHRQGMREGGLREPSTQNTSFTPPYEVTQTRGQEWVAVLRTLVQDNRRRGVAYEHPGFYRECFEYRTTRVGELTPFMPTAMQDDDLFHKISISPEPFQLEPAGYAQESPVEQFQ